MSQPFPGYYDVITVDPNGPLIGILADDATGEVGDLIFGYQPDDDNADHGIGRLMRVVDIFTTPDSARRYARVEDITDGRNP